MPHNFGQPTLCTFKKSKGSLRGRASLGRSDPGIKYYGSAQSACHDHEPAAMTPGLETARFLRVAYRSGANSILLQCSHCYFEALLDGLLSKAPKRSHWWEDGRTHLMRGAEIRRKRVWR